MARLARIHAQLIKNKLDGLIVSSQPNIAYLTGFYSSEAILLISPKADIYFTDSRYTDAAEAALTGIARVKNIKGSLGKTLADKCKSLRLAKLGFEEQNITYKTHRTIADALAGYSTLTGTRNLIETYRQIKKAGETAKIKKALNITAKALEYIKGEICPGRTETEVAGELERFIRHAGARGTAFEIIVASGPNSSFPHHRTSSRKIGDNEPVLIDIGVEYCGYNSDLTRVFFLGKMNVLARQIHRIVLKASELAIRTIREGVRASDVDAAARRYIENKGYERFFKHALGHGVGLEVHELPSISAKNTSILKAGMVFTIEPGIYLPGKFGIRHEDMILVTPKGSEVLSGSLNK